MGQIYFRTWIRGISKSALLLLIQYILFNDTKKYLMDKKLNERVLCYIKIIIFKLLINFFRKLLTILHKFLLTVHTNVKLNDCKS